MTTFARIAALLAVTMAACENSRTPPAASPPAVSPPAVSPPAASPRPAAKPAPNAPASRPAAIAQPSPSEKPKTTREDEALLRAFAAAKVPWEDGAGKSVAILENVVCMELVSESPHQYACSEPQLGNDAAKLFIEAFETRKLQGHEKGDRVVYRIASIRCVSLNENADGAVADDHCEVTTD